MKKNVKAAITGAASLLWLSFIFSNSLKNRAESARQSQGAEGLFRKVILFFGYSGDSEAVAEAVVRKAAHVFEFFVLCLFLLFTARFAGMKGKKPFLFAGAVSFIAACADETIQIFSHRGASFTDVLIDSIGIAIALVALYLRHSRAEE